MQYASLEVPVHVTSALYELSSGVKVTVTFSHRAIHWLCYGDKLRSRGYKDVDTCIPLNVT